MTYGTCDIVYTTTTNKLSNMNLLAVQELPKPSDLATNFGVIGAIVFVVCFLGWMYFKSQKPGDKKEQSSGELPREHWQKEFDSVRNSVMDQAKAQMEVIRTQGQAQVDAMRDLTKAINELTITLLRGGK